MRITRLKLCASISSLACALGGLGSCAGTSSSTSSRSDAPAISTTPSTPPAHAEAANEPEHASPHALHNVHALNDRVISGAVPDDAAAFDELRAMGVKTIISVDGASPDVAAAEARGMRYVHIPITYAQVTDQEQAEIARAIRDLPGPVYVHCHHGKHRSPAAVAAAGVALGMISPDDGIVFMKTAGTAPNYEGLYACVAESALVDDATLDAAPSDFPSIRKPQGITGAMVEVDIAFENLGTIRASQWTTPATHPDLVPAAEAGRLADQLRFSGEDAKVTALGPDFAVQLQESIDLATALEDAIVRRASATELESAYKAVSASCKSCHAAYRDKPR